MQIQKKYIYCSLFFILCLLLLASCIGVQADISIRADGSGKLALEYRVSRLAEALGRLDGNERWQTIPLGRADFERTMARLPMLRLASFSSSSDNRDIINRAELEFKNTGDLLAFFDPSGTGKYGSYTKENNTNRLTLVLSEDSSAIDDDLLLLIKEISIGYKLSFSLDVPGTAELLLMDGKGNEINTVPSGVELISRGKKVLLSMDSGDVFSLSGGMSIVFSW